ncbi:MAG: 2-oxoglutarate dehydrogenase E2 component (dihydrolipoamide succinyltransferase), partial [Candidatus Promineifilaceae bacterium]
MMHDIIVPPAGESVSSGVLAAWLKDDGALISEGEDVFEFETEKATLAVPATASGVLKQSVASGADVTIGQVVGQIDTDAATGDTATAAAPAETSESDDSQLSPAVRKLIQEHGLDASLISGSGKGGRMTKKDVEQHIATNKATQAASTPSAPNLPAPAP